MKKFIAIVMFALTISACGIKGGDPLVPVSPQERFVQADGDFKALVATVKGLVVKGVIVKDTPTAVSVDGALTTLRLALDVWEINPANLDAETATLVALQGLQSLLATVQAGKQTDIGGLSWAAAA